MSRGNRIRIASFALWLVQVGISVGVSMAAEQLKIVDAQPGKPPSDAIVLFDGGSTDAFLNVKGTPCQWPVVKGAMVVRDGFIVSKLHFRDAQIHVEFAVPDDGAKGGAAGNSGVYIFGMYEMQILNSYENPVEPKEAVGALYGISPPLVNAARKPGEWQVYEILYTAPRRDKHGRVAQPGEITAMLNGVLVQHKAHFTESISRWNPLVYQNQHQRRTGAAQGPFTESISRVEPVGLPEDNLHGQDSGEHPQDGLRPPLSARPPRQPSAVPQHLDQAAGRQGQRVQGGMRCGGNGVVGGIVRTGPIPGGHEAGGGEQPQNLGPIGAERPRDHDTAAVLWGRGPAVALSTMGILQNLSPTLQFLLAVVAFQEPFSMAQVVSFGCIWMAIAIYTADSYRAVRQDRLALVEPFGADP